MRDERGTLWFDSVLRRSSLSLVRVVLFDGDAKDRIDKRLKELGCETEYLRQYKLLAASVPGVADLGGIEAFLDQEADAGVLDYEEPILRQ